MSTETNPAEAALYIAAKAVVEASDDYDESQGADQRCYDTLEALRAAVQKAKEPLLSATPPIGLLDPALRLHADGEISTARLREIIHGWSNGETDYRLPTDPPSQREVELLSYCLGQEPSAERNAEWPDTTKAPVMSGWQGKLGKYWVVEPETSRRIFPTYPRAVQAAEMFKAQCFRRLSDLCGPDVALDAMKTTAG